ncbi:hypothetical protein [Saccharospirillum salsuginis]|uniref:Uncharacterized protein n=1 Tax=Saccharospirillum salsuginis TaxID=418750 RepID=A0A918KMR5_9GAMM|nr:hypothetical protein [Saccharospirillum salsuginis]GGX68860.1 hypothetical protein GCM10007392_40640 [Saccharospirillum salsuginis]
MTKVLAPLLLVLAGTAFANQELEQTTSAHIVNLTSIDKEVWINGEQYSISPSSGISVPCLDGEEVELQQDTQLTYIPCGEVVEMQL